MTYRYREELLWSKVETTGFCWLWTASRERGGYGKFTVRVGRRKSSRMAHRVVYEALVGAIPDGMQLDHLCRVRNCVNPDHLEPVTRNENYLRGFSYGAYAARHNTCRKGHPLEGYAAKNNRRYCKVCSERLFAAYKKQEPPKHGTRNGYNSYGCRCDKCTAANTEHSTHMREKKARQHI